MSTEVWVHTDAERLRIASKNAGGAIARMWNAGLADRTDKADQWQQEADIWITRCELLGKKVSRDDQQESLGLIYDSRDDNMVLVRDYAGATIGNALLKCGHVGRQN